MGKKAFERKLAALETLRADLGSPEAASRLRKALTDANNYYASRAARLAAESGHRSLVPDLLAAFDYHLVGGARTDKQCWAKNEICKALVELGHRDPEPYLRGSRYIQPEGVMGGEEDTAVDLRSYCALALVDAHLPVQDVLNRLADLLADRGHSVRLSAVRALASLNRVEGALPLRVLAHLLAVRLDRWGDSCLSDTHQTCAQDSELLGETCGALLSLTPPEAERLVRECAAHPVSDARAEIATALSICREPAAMEIFAAAWKREPDRELRYSMIEAAAASPIEGGFQFLLRIVESEGDDEARAALKALSANRFARDHGDAILATIRARPAGGLESVWEGLTRTD